MDFGVDFYNCILQSPIKLILCLSPLQHVERLNACLSLFLSNVSPFSKSPTFSEDSYIDGSFSITKIHNYTENYGLHKDFRDPSRHKVTYNSFAYATLYKTTTSSMRGRNSLITNYYQRQGKRKKKILSRYHNNETV